MKHLFSFAAILLFAISAQASPLWLRYPSISPDGKTIAFAYKGSIYTVATTGGVATRITPMANYDTSPIWSPDSKTIAYASNRYGNFDIFTISAKGGTPTRVTTFSGADSPYAFSPDGKRIYYGASHADPASSALFPKSSMSELYAINIEGGRPEQILATPAQYIDFNRSGDKFLYQDRKGGENYWRKHHTSSITRDAWIYDTKTGKHTQLTTWEGEDRYPRFADGDKTIYYLSERSGSFNVWSMPADNPTATKQVTKFKTHPVRFLTVADNGTLCYGFNGEIYTQQANGSPSKLKVEIIDESPTDKNTYLSVTGGGNATVSPDGKQIAFISRGELFVTSVDYTTTKRISATPQSESSPSFAADNRTLAYASEREGKWNIYTATIVRDEDPNFPNATLIEEKPLFKDNNIDRAFPKYSPDGKELAFVEGRCRLMVMDLASGKVRQITDGSQHYNTAGGIDYKWSPDGKWFALSYTGNGHDPYSDVGVVSAQGGKIVNLTNTGYFSSNPQWVLDGNALLFTTDRYGMRSHASWGSLEDVMIVFLNRKSYEEYRMSKEEYELYQEAEKKAKSDEAKSGDDKKSEDKKGDDKKSVDKKDEPKVKEIEIEFDNIDERIVRLTPYSGSVSSYTISKDGKSLFYITSLESGYDLWQLDLRDRSNKIVQKGIGSGSLVWDKKRENLFHLGGSMKRFKGGTPTAPTTISVRSEMSYDPAEERAYMLDRIYHQEKERFYTESMHGVDWEAMYKNYAQFLPYINNNYDFAEMASELLGELNVSHTGCTYSGDSDSNSEITAHLGAIFDMKAKGNGLTIAEVIAGGPLDKASMDIKSGDVIEKIDGVEIKEGMDYFPLLNRKGGKRTLLSLYRPADGKRWEQVMTPTSVGTINKLLYKRWIKQRAADVERLSNGRLGYVHIESMNDGSFRTIYADILGKYNHCDGIVIDTRFNGGGRLHEDIEILFSGEKYLTQVIRGKEACDMPSRRYNKPSIMITCEANYSNAHGTPWVYQKMGIGKVVGMPVPGTMTSVSWERLQDPTLTFGIPVVGYRMENGQYLENTQLEPDIKVANSPEVIITGRDEQLEAAVKALLEEIDSKKK
ncbi:MAG: PD40 domain-containing protein [Alistipes sp.]|nr:PD40 domain-containing protein [Alistipes sp.]